MSHEIPPRQPPHPKNGRLETQILAPKDVPPEIQAIREQMRGEEREKSPQRPPTPEEDFHIRKKQVLQNIQTAIEREQRIVNKAQDKYAHPILRTRKGSEKAVQTDKSLIEEQRGAEEALLLVTLEKIFVERSNATTMEAFSREVARAEEEAAKELQKAYNDPENPETLLNKRRTLEALTELKRLFTSEPR